MNNKQELFGYYDESGKFIVCGESGTDQQLGKYDSEVMNGYGYYDETGKFQRTYYWED